MGSAQGQTLDDYFHKIQSSGGLTNLCIASPEIAECKSAIGKWKPDQLEQVKSLAPYCYERCEYDQYGFVKSSAGGPEFPLVVTKDFDGSSASRGIEFQLFPVALKTFKYEGCVGCSLNKRYPSKVEFLKQSGGAIQLPRLARGTFYLPVAARSYAMQAAGMSRDISVRLSFNNETETRRISKKALASYALMLRSLMYDRVR